MERVK